MAAVASAAAFVAVQMVSRLNTCPQVDRSGPNFLSPPLFFLPFLLIIFLIVIIPCAISPSERSTGPAIYFGTKEGDSSIRLDATHGPGPRV